METRNCPNCGRSAGLDRFGRPLIYCSVPCRRAGEYQQRRIDRIWTKVDELEIEMRLLGDPPPPGAKRGPHDYASPMETWRARHDQLERQIRAHRGQLDAVRGELLEVS